MRILDVVVLIGLAILLFDRFGSRKPNATAVVNGSVVTNEKPTHTFEEQVEAMITAEAL